MDGTIDVSCPFVKVKLVIEKDSNHSLSHFIGIFSTSIAAFVKMHG